MRLGCPFTLSVTTDGISGGVGSTVGAWFTRALWKPEGVEWHDDLRRHRECPYMNTGRGGEVGSSLDTGHGLKINMAAPCSEPQEVLEC